MVVYMGLNSIQQLVKSLRAAFYGLALTHFCPPLRSTFAVRETDVSRHNGGTSGAPLKPLRDELNPSETARSDLTSC